MQRPRRTSEFHDDPSGIRRQSRVQQRNTLAPSPQGGTGTTAEICSTGTIKKYSARQSRIAIPTRQSSTERGGSAYPYLAVPSSSIKRGVTPQKTPLAKPSANRALFTAEKQRTGQGGNAVALHNDKKWVQEQTQRITEHLLSQNTLGAGISSEFLNRGLRQMSIKQFVAIINYFLGYIWGNRYIVGSNHVEDIINILQKLQYPHPVNKSWLKTPNTQHSFGNIIVLLDFLMDFLPPSKEECSNFYFDLKEPEELSVSRLNEEPHQIPDLEFQRELLRNSENGFMLWDKQKKEEFDNLQLHTCNLLIQKICGVENLEAVSVEIEKLQGVLKQLESERPPEDKEMMKMKSKLTQELKNLRRETKTLQDECDINERDIKELKSRKKLIAKEVESLEIEIKSLHEMLNKQQCTVEQRDQMMADVVQHKQMVAIKERTIRDLENRYHNQQILQSKAIKQLNDNIETFNAHMREIKFSDIMKDDASTSFGETNLELSLRPQQLELEKVITLLIKIKQKAVQLLQSNKTKLFHIQEHCKQLTNDIDTKLHPKLNILRSANTSNLTNLQKTLHTLQQEEYKMIEAIQKIDEDLISADKSIEELKLLIEHKKSLVDELKQANEQTMQHAEEKHRQCLEQKKAFLQAYDEMLEECIQNDVLQQLIEQVQMQEKQLEEFKKDFRS